ncbi:MAG: tripartite tricarboxylate transporter TctB family protein [Polaromonas sp.]|nr:tripartite tricarboxylate transporter TctB family protein [Polaromonas sp.]
MFLGTGTAFAWGSTNYSIGSAARMGAGYFPFMLGILMAIIGTVITFKALATDSGLDDKIGSWAW